MDGAIVASAPEPKPTTGPPLAPPSSPAEQRERTFDELLIGFLGKTMTMLEHQAEVAGEHAFVRSNPRDALELARFLTERADAVMGVVRKLRDASPRTDL